MGASMILGGAILKLPAFLKLTNTDPFAAWSVVTGDATLDGIRVVRSVLGAISPRAWSWGGLVEPLMLSYALVLCLR